MLLSCASSSRGFDWCSWDIFRVLICCGDSTLACGTFEVIYTSSASVVLSVEERRNRIGSSGEDAQFVKGMTISTLDGNA